MNNLESEYRERLDGVSRLPAHSKTISKII
jgi:hypothetical protein